MINYNDSFGRLTILQILDSAHYKNINIVIRKERQSVYESLSLETAKLLLKELEQAIKIIEESNGQCE